MQRKDVQFTARVLIILVGVLVVSSVFCGVVTADEQELVAFVPDTDWPPYLVESEDGELKGLFPDLLRAVVEPLGYKVRMLRLPNRRGWRMLDAGEVDLHFKAKEWVHNVDDYLWSETLFNSEDVLLYSKERTLYFDSIRDLEGLRIAVVRSFVYPELAELFTSGKAQAVQVDSPFAMLDLVALGRVDAAVVNRAETLWLFRTRPELNGDRFDLTQKAMSVFPYRFVFSRQKNWASFIEKLDTELKAMKADGRMKNLVDRYR